MRSQSQNEPTEWRRRGRRPFMDWPRRGNGEEQKGDRNEWMGTANEWTSGHRLKSIEKALRAI